MPRRTLAVALTLLTFGCKAAPSASSVDATAAIAEQNKKFGEAVTARSAAAIAALYAEDATLLPPNAPAVQGRAAIQGYWQAFLDAGVTNATLTSAEVINTATDATEVGTWVILAPNGSVADKGKYIVWWKKTGETWSLYRDIFNSDQPAAPATK